MNTKHQKQRGLILVSNRLPLSIKKEGDSFQSSLSSGGLVTALSGLTQSMKFRWFGWPGIYIEDDEDQKRAAESLTENNATGIFLDPELAHEHYNGFSNCILWPILHYQSGVEFDETAWAAYQRVNEIFADIVAGEANDGDFIWVHDYHLLLLPSLLRKRLKEHGKQCPIGFTLHTPFPAGDFWRSLPVHNDLLKGVLASDVVGFHTDEYQRNFTDRCAQSLNVTMKTEDRIVYEGHETFVGTFIVGIDPQKFSDSRLDPKVQDRIRELEKEYKDKKVIIGIDRLDYTKGIVQKLKGYDHFLQQHPDLVNKVVLIQVAIPSREDVKEYQELAEEVSFHTGRFIGKYSSADGTPLIYMHRSVSFTELTALYCISDVCLLTSRRDGMNLVASEYVACQAENHGVLILSELAGAASFLKPGSIIFHPSREQEMADAIYRAVTMDEKEKEERYRGLIDFVSTHTSAKWGESFINALEGYSER